MPDAAEPYAVGQRDTRPWGEWMVIDAAAGFVVKRITVQPGQRLSLQRHRHRAEQWVVVAGVAQVTLGAAEFPVGVGGTVRIEPGQTHRVANHGVDDVVFIEAVPKTSVGKFNKRALREQFKGYKLPGQ